MIIDLHGHVEAALCAYLHSLAADGLSIAFQPVRKDRDRCVARFERGDDRYRGAAVVAWSRLACGCTGASLNPSDHLIASNIMIWTFRMSQASGLCESEL
jgi:hypothetical protein